MVGDCSTVTTEEPLRELGYGEIYSSIYLCHFIITAVPAEPRLVLHEILLQPLKSAPGLHSGICRWTCLYLQECWKMGLNALIYVELRQSQPFSTSKFNSNWHC